MLSGPILPSAIVEVDDNSKNRKGSELCYWSGLEISSSLYISWKFDQIAYHVVLLSVPRQNSGRALVDQTSVSTLDLRELRYDFFITRSTIVCLELVIVGKATRLWFIGNEEFSTKLYRGDQSIDSGNRRSAPILLSAALRIETLIFSCSYHRNWIHISCFDISRYDQANQCQCLHLAPKLLCEGAWLDFIF